MPFVLDILRHGEAEPVGDAGDRGRALTARGRAAVERLALELAAGPPLDRIFASPLLRAHETARIVVSALTRPPTIETLAALEPEAAPEAVMAELEARGALAGHVLLVSHMPLVARLTSWWCGEIQDFAAPTLVRLVCEGRAGRGAAIVSGRIDPGRI
ncbi:MAG TPA: histidine phosphatase family protein [Candidatus Saccharimonadaceae bacterium]|nr:histidine phosphatase family protein [Candidatus Saccharimonadaceae bacterium]